MVIIKMRRLFKMDRVLLNNKNSQRKIIKNKRKKMLKVSNKIMNLMNMMYQMINDFL